MNNPVTTKSFADLDQLIDASTAAFQTFIAGIHRSPTGGVNGDGTARVVLTGGTAGIRFLAKLRNAGIDWSRVKVFFGDERNVPVDHADSNEGQARDALLDHVAIPERNIFGYGLNGGSMEDAVSRYAALLSVEAPAGFDLHLLGMGGEGHINSLFPHTTALQEEDALVVAVTDSPKPPSERISLTLPAVRRAQQVWLLVSGPEKAEAAAAVAGRANYLDWPAAGATGKDGTILWVSEDAAPH